VKGSGFILSQFFYKHASHSPANLKSLKDISRFACSRIFNSISRRKRALVIFRKKAGIHTIGENDEKEASRHSCVFNYGYDLDFEQTRIFVRAGFDGAL
jgi:hypothetical protein